MLPEKIEIFNVKGQKVKSLECGESLATTADGVGYSISWDGKDENGRIIGNGVYFNKVKIGEKEFRNKFIVVR